MKKINHRQIVYILLIVICIYTVFSLLFPKQSYVSKTNEIKSLDILGEVENNDVIEQTFISDDDYLKFGIYLATYTEILREGNLIIKITDEDNKTEEIKVMISRINNDSYYYIDYKLEKNKKYDIAITMENSTKPITLYTTKQQTKDAELKYNGEPQDSMLVLSFMYEEDYYFNIWYCLMASALILAYLVMTKPSKE